MTIDEANEAVAYTEEMIAYSEQFKPDVTRLSSCELMNKLLEANRKLLEARKMIVVFGTLLLTGEQLEDDNHA